MAVGNILFITEVFISEAKAEMFSPPLLPARLTVVGDAGET